MTESQLEVHLAQIPTPPIEFYYGLTLFFATALIWIIKVYIARVDATLKQLVETQQGMLTMLAVHEEKHKEADKKKPEQSRSDQMEETLQKLNQTLTILNSNYGIEDKKRGRG